MKEPKTSIRILLLTVTAALGIALLDLLPSTRGIPWHGFFILPVVWIALWSAEDDILTLAGMATLVTCLALLRGFISHESTATVPLGERLVLIAAIWLTVILALLRKRSRRTFRWVSLIGRR